MAEEAPDDLDEEVLADDELAPEGGEDTQPASFDPEAVARLAGWSPKTEWRGDPADWKDAGTFLVDTAAVNKTLRKDVKELRRTVENVGRTAERIIQSERSRALADARVELRQAVQAGDEDAADAAAERIQRASSAPVEGGASTADEFSADHAWFGIHAAATGLAQTEAEKIYRAGGDVKAQFAAAEVIVRKKFPELFEDEAASAPAERQRQQPVVQGGQRTPRVGSKDPVASLTAEERKAGESFVRATKGRMTLAMYAQSLREDQA